MTTKENITNQIKNYAINLGFDLVGVTPAKFNDEGNYFVRWLNEGYAGEMKYLERNSRKRVNIEEVLPNAKSVISCAINYNTDYPYSTNLKDKKKGWIARYAWGDDYHSVLIEMLNKLKNYLISLYDEGIGLKAYVDTGPVLEKVFSEKAGVGWIGKNTCLINQEMGSWLLIGEIITDIELKYDSKAVDRCGSCTRCIDACPTDAIVKPYVLDSRKCISYLTIELKDKIPVELREGLDNNVFGCDICQDVCPWNSKATVTEVENFQPRVNLFNPDLEYLLNLKQGEFSREFKNSPIKRTKRKGLIRNVLVAMGNSRNRDFTPYIERMLNDEEPLIRIHAVWALWKIEGVNFLYKLKELKEVEENSEVLEEISYILDLKNKEGAN
ncbi:MAG: tRNA epoxyqueuosine(34) reductase QueG [Candidatus Dadabacteria bacterium]|nr:tRNA epoxyqueuosine(34) reductase QueG [Candidatus Dadabacteria bacterium]NIQ16132.1 tRNA epoxyqueuosine(34) reductase QueG [Candidatus Dadabacteria bacterium]